MMLNLRDHIKQLARGYLSHGDPHGCGLRRELGPEAQV